VKYEVASAVSTTPAWMRLTRTGASSRASAAVKGGSTANAAAAIPDSRSNVLTLPPVSSSVPPGRILGAA
jgi:hypothetical protein